MSSFERLAAVLGLLSSVGCNHQKAWMKDESERIDDVMRDVPFDSQLPGAHGIAVVYAPPLAPPWKEGEGYQITPPSQGNTRLGKTDRKRPKKVQP